MKIFTLVCLILISCNTFANSQKVINLQLPDGLNAKEWQSVTKQIKDNGNDYQLLGAGINLQQQSYVKASNTDDDDLFGYRVDISGDTMAVAAPLEESSLTVIDGDETDNSGSLVGAVYVFVRSNGTWQQQAYLKADNADNSDLFGYSIAVSVNGNTIVVGSPKESSNATGVSSGGSSDNSLSSAGAAYVFTRSAGVWTQQAYLKAFNPSVDDKFGADVDISINTIVVGSSGEDNGYPNSGGAYVFTRLAEVWSQQAFIKASNLGVDDYFGGKVAISQSTIVVSAPGEDSSDTGVNGPGTDNSESESGAAYVYVRSAGSWTQTAYLKASNTEAGDEFGNSIAIDDDTIVVGAYHEDSGDEVDQADNSASASGAVYVFNLSGATWAQQAYIKAPNLDAGDEFGTSVEIELDNLIVGAASEESDGTGVNGDDANNDLNNAGAAYIFTRSSGSWSYSEYLKASNTEEGDLFGADVALSGNTYIVSAVLESSDATGVDGDDANNSSPSSGAAYVFNPHYNLGGTVTGLEVSTSVTIQNNGSNDTTVLESGSGYFGFIDISDDSSYDVTVSVQPTGPNQLCNVTGGDNNDGTGVIDGEDYTGILINCETIYHTVGGAVSGLESGNEVVLQLDGSDDLTINANGIFTFPVEVYDETAYSVTVLTNPSSPNQVCSITNGEGASIIANVTDIAVECVTIYHSVGGTVTGLESGNELVLQNLGLNDLTITSNGSFTFTTDIPEGTAYGVTILTQPIAPDQICTVTNADDSTIDDDITDVIVSCITTYYIVGGAVSGLGIGNEATIQINGGDDLILNADGLFTFATGVAGGLSYEVTVLNQPSTPDQICTVSNGFDIAITSDATNVSINCNTIYYSVGGTVSGLETGGEVVLQNNGGDDLVINANGLFTFATEVAGGQSYNVSVVTQPSSPEQICTVADGNDNIANDISNIVVNCVTTYYSIGGTVYSLGSGNEVVLQNNGGDDLTINTDGSFVFATQIAGGITYDITILSQPSFNQVCQIDGTSSLPITGDVLSIEINCDFFEYTIGGTLSGLASGNQVVLQNEGGDDLTLASNGMFAFSELVIDTGSYEVTVLTQPSSPNQVCSVSNGSDDGALTENVTDIEVKCSDEIFSNGFETE